jgi:hypothetical protein
MNFIVTHVFREDNCYADRLADISLSINKTQVWMDVVHDQVLEQISLEIGLDDTIDLVL